MRELRLFAVAFVVVLVAVATSLALPVSTVSTGAGIQPMQLVQPSLSLASFPYAAPLIDWEVPATVYGAPRWLSVGRGTGLQDSFARQATDAVDPTAQPPGASIMAAARSRYQVVTLGTALHDSLPQADGAARLDDSAGSKSLELTNTATSGAAGQIQNFGGLLLSDSEPGGVLESGSREPERMLMLVPEHSLAAQCVEILSPAGIPSPTVIDFDDMSSFAIIGTHYQASHGVTFESSSATRGTIYGNEPLKAQSSPNVAYNDAVSPYNSRNLPMRIYFDLNQTHVGFWIGNGETVSPTATLTAYDGSNSPICSVQKTVVPDPHTEFIGILDPSASIASVALDYGDTLLSESIDDLHFAHVTTELIPPSIGNIRPSNWVTTTRTPSVYADVVDAGYGISVASASYRYSTEGGTTWSSPITASVSGSNGVTSTQTMTATSVPFNADSATQNLIEFRIVDMVGNVGTARGTIAVDITPPTAPVTLTSSSHTVDLWSDDNTITVIWGGAADATSGVNGYSVLFDHNPGGIPDQIADTSATSFTSPLLDDARDWYAHVRVRDLGGLWSASARHLGPLKIDTTAPGNPSVSSSTHSPSVWSNDSTIAMNWSSGSDGGSGVFGYSFLWNTSPNTLPDTNMDTDIRSTVSAPLSSGDNHYFHLRVTDAAGNWSGAAVHRGPYYVDRIDPTSSVTTPLTSGSLLFTVALSGADAHSGIASYDVQYRDFTAGSGWMDWILETPSISHPFLGSNAHIYQFRSRARDNAGNVEAYPNTHDSETWVSNLDLWVRNPGLEVNQSVQDLNNSVFLIAGKRTFVRAYVQGDANSLSGVPARLRVSRGGLFMGELRPSNAGGTATVRRTPDRSNLEHSFYFDVPTGWLTAGQVTFQFDLNSPLKYAESDYTNNSRTITVSFGNAPPMNLLILNVPYVDGVGVVQNIRAIDRTLLASWLRRAYPISTLNVRRTSLLTPYAALPNINTTVNPNLSSIKARAVVGGEDPWRRYYGMVSDVGGFAQGWAVSIPGTVAAGPTGVPGSPLTAWDTDQSYGDWYGAHELGHTYGRRHVTGAGPVARTCGAEPGGFIDYPNGDISPTQTQWSPNAIYGLDSGGPTVIPPSWKDVMTYCSNQWISDRTYEGILTQMIFENPVAPAALRELAVAGGEHLAVFGTIVTPTDQITLTSVYRVPEGFDVFTRDTSGEFHIVLLDAGNGQLADYRFSLRLSSEDDEPVGMITELVPWVTDTRKISIVHNGSVLTSRNVSANSPSVTLVYPNGGEILSGGSVTVTWTASDADGDGLTYSLDYSRDGGTTWTPVPGAITATQIAFDLNDLPGTTQGRFRVWANDGVNSAGESSNADFTVTSKTPGITEILPGSGRTYVVSQTVTFEGQAYDAEDGQLADSRLVWSSSLMGSIGAGQVLGISDLVTGTHVITLTATDSDNNSTQATTTVVVTEEPLTSGTTYLIFLPGVFRSY